MDDANGEQCGPYDAVEVYLPPIPETVRERLQHSLGISLPECSADEMTLRIIAMSHATQKNGSKGTVRSRQRNRIKKLASRLGALEEALSDVTTDDLRMLLTEGRIFNINNFKTLHREVRRWRPIAERIAEKRLPRAREADQQLRFTCGALAFYFSERGSRSTHTTWKNSVDRGSPQSPFGKFAVSFFQYADPALKPKDLNAALADVVWPSRRKKQNQATE
jgi:hypothetical protein